MKSELSLPVSRLMKSSASIEISDYVQVMMPRTPVDGVWDQVRVEVTMEPRQARMGRALQTVIGMHREAN